MLSQILSNEAGLSKDQRFSPAWSGDAHDRSFAQRMDLLQFWRCELAGLAFENLDIEVNIALLEKPDEALGAGLVQPVFFFS